MIDQRAAREFLGSGHLAIVGASDDDKNFGSYIRTALIGHGVDVVSVNPHCETVGGQPCYPDLQHVPGEIDGAVLMISGPTVLDVIKAAAARGVPRVWLFKGLGGPGAASSEAVSLCEELGLEVIAGACPMMFLEPVRGAHRLHRAVRRLNHAIG